MRTRTGIAAIAAVAALALAGCSDPGTTTDTQSEPQSDSGQSQAAAGMEITPFDISTISVQEDIAALVPQAIKDRGILRNGASTDYAPGEYRADDGQTPVGYDVDLVRALARVMGLEDGQTSHAEFPTIIPALGSKFDVGVSSFSVSPERIEQVNMISYVEVGSAYAVAAGNPKDFDPNNICGTTIGVQTGTYQHDYLLAQSDQCVADGKKAIEVMPLTVQTDVSTKVIGGQYDATLADSTVIGYTVKKSDGKLEQIGDVIESAPQGITVKKDDEALTEAIQKALQYLMDNGYLTQILAPYGADGAALTTAELNPAS
ncbi:ABC transporter substrate-binding protein [Scrofimicrobium sp. R131]|uniref:ABC transporter substrate-binding protein n=1 Tax=Scrofimicrobium appendicitidis TaxID=3079930 RepID=A0AAU7V727_9ACTO